jgi:predicted lysophospholipase L1 biosynthesis ABC-type transport system permease subunit
MGFFKGLINVIFWLQAFLAPVLLFGLIGLIIGSMKIIVVLLAIGAIAGIILAEWIRRKIGLDTFFGRIYGPNEMDEKLKKKD